MPTECSAKPNRISHGSMAVRWWRISRAARSRRTRAGSCSERPTGRSGSSSASRPASRIAGRRSGWSTRWRRWSGSGCSASRSATRTWSSALTSGAQEGFPLLPGHAHLRLQGRHAVQHPRLLRTSPGVTVSGAKWPLDDVEVPFGSSLTVSNEVRGGLRISFSVGRALLIAHPYPGKASSLALNLAWRLRS